MCQNQQTAKPLTFGSLFAGIGGFDLGLERAGMECRWQVEIDDYACRVLAKHWPSVQRWGDVRTFPPGSAAEWDVNVICAGVPCQPVSHAGKRKGVDDERWMWGEALRVVADIKPRFFVAENPNGILSHDGGRTFGGIMRALAACGYVCEWQTIAAADMGAPHQRDRVWLVAYTDSVSCSQGKSRRTSGRIFAKGARSQGREDEGEAGAIAGSGGEDAGVAGKETVNDTCGVGEMHMLRKLHVQDSRNARSRLQLRPDRGMGGIAVSSDANMADANGQGLEGAMLEHPCQGLLRPCSGARGNEEQEVPASAAGWWASEPAVGRMAHGVPNRMDRLRCLGNAVVPQIVELIGRKIMQR